MKKHIVTAFILLIAFTSCQKELSYTVDQVGTGTNPGTGGGTGGGGTGGGSNGSILVRAVQTQGNDSTIFTYEYDSNSKLIKVNAFESASPTAIYYGRVYRDATGRVTTAVQKIDVGLFPGIPTGFLPDSVVYSIKYPTTTSTNFTYKIAKVVTPAVTVYDSVVYTYSGNNIISETNYNYSTAITTAPEPSGKTTYAYDANGNVTQSLIYNYNSTTSQFELEETNNYTMDTKLNPLAIGKEFLLIETGWGSGANNIINSTNLSGGVTTTATINFLYNTSNFPKSGTLVETNPTATYNLALYYN